MGIISGVALIVIAILLGIIGIAAATISPHFIGVMWLIVAGAIAFDLLWGRVPHRGPPA